MEGRRIVIHERRSSTFLTSLLVGAIVGAGVSLLVAPKSGNETRRILGEKSSQVKDKAVHLVDNTRQKAQDAVTNVRSRLGRGDSSVRELKQETKIMEDSIKRTYDL